MSCGMKALPRVRIVERRLGREKALGQAWVGAGLVEVDPRQPERERLDTIVHELLHHLEPDWDEQRVAVSAAWLATVLWRQGYRRIRQ